MFAPLLLVACGEGAAPTEETAAAVNGLQAGQWEVTSEVSGFRQADEGQPKIDTPVGTTASASLCVGEETRPPTEIFSGEGYSCQYGNFYMRNGRINITLNCTREGLSGNIGMTVDGRFQADSFEADRNIRTTLVTDGDVVIDAALTGRRTGDCPAEADAEAEG
jgi:hypothetical protein